MVDKKSSSSIFAVLTISILVVGLFASTNATASSTPKKLQRSSPFVGGDLHTLTFTKNGLFVTGHQAGDYSTDDGLHWKSIATLKNVDSMSWASTDSAYFAGGHNGLFKSTNGGKSFTRIKFFGNASDVHAIGASKKIVYMGSPQVGFLRSIDGGKSWKIVNAKFGQGFMGSMLVDSSNPLRVIAPDMNNGLVLTVDGGKTWALFGGPQGAMSIGWNPNNNKEIATLGMNVGALSKDDGKTWSTFSVPMGSAAITLSSTGKRIYVATLVSEKAVIFSTDDAGKHWAQ